MIRHFFLYLCLGFFLTESARLQGQSTPFTFLQTGYTQAVFGAATTPSIFGGVAFAANGDVFAKPCSTNDPPVRFVLNSVVMVNGASVHSLQPGPATPTAAGCGMTNHPDGHLYVNGGAGARRVPARWPELPSVGRTFPAHAGSKPPEVLRRMIEEARQIRLEDIAVCRAIGRNGAALGL